MSKKGENIYKRKDGRWEARYIKGCSTEGKTVYGYCYGKTYREAKGKVTEAKAYLTQKTYIPGVGSRRCLASYCDEWLQLNRSKVKESTYVKCLSMLEKHVKPKLLEMEIITPAILRELIDRIEVYETQGTGKDKIQRIAIYYRFVGYLELPEGKLNPNYTADLRRGVAVEYIPKIPA